MGLHEEWPGLDTLSIQLQSIVEGQYARTTDAVVGLMEQARADLQESRTIVDAWGSMSMRLGELVDAQPESIAEGYACALAAMALLRWAGEREIAERQAAERQPSGEGSFSIAPRLTWMTMADLDAIKGPGEAA